MSNQPSQETQRQSLAISLRAAMLDVSIAKMLDHGEIPASAMAQWLRVADVAMQFLAPIAPQPKSASDQARDRRRPDSDANQMIARHFMIAAEPVKPDHDGMTWCNQCDRRVTAAFEAACKSKFCSLHK